jgi:hypothetical protein
MGSNPDMPHDEPERRIARWARRVFGPKLPIREPVRELCVCPDCKTRVVVTVDVGERDDEHWWLRLRCGECSAMRELIATDEEAQRYGRELDRGVALIAGELARLERERMADEARMLSEALERDLIDAGDFER